MPVSRNYHVPEVRNSRVRPQRFNVLLLGLEFNQISTVSIYTGMLHDYLDSLGLTNNRIVMHVAVGTTTRLLEALVVDNSELQIHEVDVNSKETILELANSLDIDILLDEEERFTKREIYANRDKMAIVHWYNPFFNDLLNSICTGWGVVWNFRDPVWNASWITKYLESPYVARKVFDFMQISQEQGYSSEQVNFIRSLSNKITHATHAKQSIDYTMICYRYANRHGMKTTDILFELSHHLNNYYMWVSSSLDISARLINSVYTLGFQTFNSYTLDNAEFLRRLEPKRKGLVNIIRLKKYMDWMDWMRQRRNFFAHQSHLYLSPLVQRKAEQLSDEEMNQIVEGFMDWNYLSTTGMSDDAIQNLKDFMKFQVDLDENHETKLQDVIPMNKRDRLTEEVKPVLFFPLKAVDEDYAKFTEIIGRVIDNLTGARPVN